MNPYLDERYFVWLYQQVRWESIKNPAETYRKLLYILFTKEYVWFIPNDDNRMEDGLDLRQEFAIQEDMHISDHDWLTMGCSFLEFLIGVSRRLEFQSDRIAKDWFWQLIYNMGFNRYNDLQRYSRDDVDERLDRVIWRTYSYNGGDGGLFPLQYPERDQREIEIWYQLSAYLLENS